LSLQGQPDPTHFITSFTGSHRFVLDYLVEEVLSRQPEHIQTFLLYTSILNRLSGRLCEALLNDSTTSGQVTLEYLERANLLVVPLDDQRQWYRYHHLFADVLQTRLMQEHVQHVPMLHQRASTWYEHHGLPADAIYHAFAAKDFERAAGLIELAGITMRSIKQEATMLGWVKQLPDQLIRTRPVLSVVTAWALLDGGELEAAESRLQDAERWLNTTTTTQVDEMVVVDEVQFRSLRASIANARAYRAQALGDIPGTVMHARYAIDFLPEDAYYERGTTTALLGIAYWASGELEAAYQSFANGLASLQMGGGILIVIGGTIILAHIRIAQGRLHDAISICKQSLQLATEQGAPILRGTAELYMGLSELYCEQGDLETATQYLRRGETLREQASLPGYEYFWCIAQARLKEAHDDLDGAMERLHEAERLYYKSPIPDVRPIAALKARVWIKQGKLAEALGWAHNHNISVDDELSYLHEYEHVTLARIRIAQYRHDRIEQGIQEALGLLERLLRAAEAGKRNGSIIEILVLQALTHEVQGHSDAALEPLERALTLAEPESYIRIFVDEGPPMALLLQAAAQQRIAPNYVARLRAAFGAIEDRTPVTQHLVEPLSEREIDVLRLLGTELSGPDIARELVVSLNTLRTHTKNIYSKLGVSNRRAAVRRAEELHLL
ncbi:MAG: LuxR C-terminal-related transcriptional regulator, partial [Chloroflexota bacterium]